MAVSYTHNLKLILVDNEDNIVDENDEKNQSKFELLKSFFFQENTHTIRWNNTSEKYTIKWDMIILDKLNTQFMGDLFSCPVYNFDSIIIEHTQKTIRNVSKICGFGGKYKIKFHISRIAGNRTICKDSYGVIK